MTEPGWINRATWTGDNLDIMRVMDAETVDIIYLDPPFNANRNYAAPIGSQAVGAHTISHPTPQSYMAAPPPNPKTEIALVSPLCAHASNPGALVSLTTNHPISTWNGGRPGLSKKGNRR